MSKVRFSELNLSAARVGERNIMCCMDAMSTDIASIYNIGYFRKKYVSPTNHVLDGGHIVAIW